MTTHPALRRSAVLAVAVVMFAVMLGPAHAGPAARRKAAVGSRTWAPARTAAVHPGVQTFTDGTNQCTANFVFTDETNVYVGQAAHCAGTGAATDTDGCDSGSLPLGTKVEIGGATRPGTLVYSSWLTMQRLGERDRNTCAYNDFALVRLDPADVGSVNPSVPFWGGPRGLGKGTRTGEDVYSYGNSMLRLGIRLLSPKYGISLGDSGGGWSTNVYTATPGIPGDSGSAFLDFDGDALGTLSTVQILPLAASNGVSNLTKQLAYLHATEPSLASVVLEPGTQPFLGLRPVKRNSTRSIR